MATTGDPSGHPLHDLSAFQRDLLTTIEQLGAPHGLAIKEEMTDLYDGADINHGRLYPNLDELVEMGLVEKGEKDRRTNEYSLSDDGRRQLASYSAWVFDGESAEAEA